MRSRSSFVLALGFSVLVVLIAVLGIGAIRRARTIYAEMERTQESYLGMEAFRRDIAADMYLADILLRDFLLDPSPHNTQLHRQQLFEIRSSLQQRLDDLEQNMGQSNSPELARLQNEVQAYWDSLDPIFEWTTQDKAEQSWAFLRRRVLPRRRAVVDLAREIARLNRENLEKERLRIQASQRRFDSFLLRMMIFSLSVGVLASVVTTYRVSVLEQRDNEQRRQIQQAEDNLRRLSRRLVQAQEAERKSLSRELHDEVGQMLTALGMELANLEPVRETDPAAYRERLEDAKRLNADVMRVLRDLAMGLRPSMLDDLGLEPALQWQGREFSRHASVPATVEVLGELENLSEAQRTCIYRVVQEALTNCARHANAKQVTVRVDGSDERIQVTVEDDGTGFNPAAPSRVGLGLLGIRERVEELNGRLLISSRSGEGTKIYVELPTAQEAKV